MLDVKEIDSPVAGFWIEQDLIDREEAALKQHADFFNSIDHIKRCEQVMEIVTKFFPVRKNLYANHRGNRGHPMTVIKIEDPNFPNHLTSEQKAAQYYQPLADLGVEIVYSRNTGSYLHRVK